jgi:hypothetical protein
MEKRADMEKAEKEAERVLDELVALGFLERHGRELRLSDWAVGEILKWALDIAVKGRETGRRINVADALAMGCIVAYVKKKAVAREEEAFWAVNILMTFIELEMEGHEGVVLLD